MPPTAPFFLPLRCEYGLQARELCIRNTLAIGYCAPIAVVPRKASLTAPFYPHRQELQANATAAAIHSNDTHSCTE